MSAQRIICRAKRKKWHPRHKYNPRPFSRDRKSKKERGEQDSYCSAFKIRHLLKQSIVHRFELGPRRDVEKMCVVLLHVFWASAAPCSIVL